MGTSLGELFVSLGFEVDNKTLKDFHSEIKDTMSSVLAFAGITASGAGFTALLNGAADTATKLEQLNKQYGLSIDAVQRFAAAGHAAVPTTGVEQWLNMAMKAQDYITNMQKGTGGNELAWFGRGPEIKTFEQLIERMRTGLPTLIAQRGGGEQGLNFARQQIAAILGNADAINILNMSTEQYNRTAENGPWTPESIHNLSRYNNAIADLTNSFDQLKASWLAVPAEAMADFLNGKEKKTQYNGFSDYLNKRGAAGFVWDSFLGGLGIIGSGLKDEAALTTIGAENIFGGQGSSDALTQAFLKTHGMQKTLPWLNVGSSPSNGYHNPGNLQPGGIEASFPDDATGLAAMAANLQRYGAKGWNTVDSIVEHWAPAAGKGNSKATEDAYKLAIEKALGVGGSQPLDLSNPDMLAQLMAPMIRQEQGKNPFSDAQLKQAANSTTTVYMTNNFNGGNENAQQHAQTIADQINTTRNQQAWGPIR